MKIQHLAVIFIIVIMPIIIVFSEYLNTQITIVKTERIYDARLFDSTHDAINAFKLNTINSTYYAPQSRVQNIEASVNTFYNSIVTSFDYRGVNAEAMKEYVPAVVFTMYDGYYIYSPFVNTLTNVDADTVDDKYEDGKIIDGLKPFVSYSCRYLNNNKEYIITYSMDNYIFVDVFDKSNQTHESKSGYLINGITKNGNNYTYQGITFKENDEEILKEKIGKNNAEDTYYYTIVDGTKYYYFNTKTNNGAKPSSLSDTSDTDYIFYIDEQRTRHKQVISKLNNEEEFEKYYNKIFKNNYGYLYYKEAYEFTEWVRNNLGGITKNNIINSVNYDGYEFAEVGNIFEGDIEYSNSNFNRHRSDVIRAVISTNLSKAISGYSRYSKSTNVEFIMPKILEKDWELLENNICIVSFLQGMKVGSSDKTYNSYSIIPNNFNKEYVDENDIYILTKDKTYTKPNDDILKDGTNILEKDTIGFEPGLSKMDFEIRQDIKGDFYNPVTLNGNLFLRSYTSYAGSSNINSIEKIDMYRYMMEPGVSNKLKKAYYVALGRERYSSFKYTMNEF